MDRGSKLVMSFVATYTCPSKSSKGTTVRTPSREDSFDQNPQYTMKGEMEEERTRITDST